MSHGTICVGLDVHVSSIVVATLTPEGEAHHLGRRENTPKAIARLLRRISEDWSRLHVVYEAGPTGFVIARQLAELGVRCTVAAPSLLPRKPGDRVKTDRRDALALARALANEDVTGVTVPTAELEALRALSRHREAVKGDLHRVRQRLLKLLHARGIAEPLRPGTDRPHVRWRGPWLAWLETVALPEGADQLVLDELRTEVARQAARLAGIEQAVQERLATSSFAAFFQEVQALRGVGPITAAGIVTEFGDLRRFATPTAAMAYVGVVPSEHSSGAAVRRGGITRTGNAHLRWLLIEAAWHYRRAPATRPAHPIAARASDRLTTRYRHHLQRGKPPVVVATAIARELIGFIWSMAQPA